MNKLLTLLILCLLFLAFLPGCEKEVKVSGIIVEPKNVYLSKGDVVQLACLVTPFSADNKSVRWTSNDVSIATVSQTGLVTAISDGKTQIVATTKDGNFTDTVSVIVARGSPAGDSIALIKLYEIARYLPYWDLSKPMDTWEGIVLNADRRVLYITGTVISIKKPLDVSIGNLTFLKYLALSAEYSSGNIIIPVEIGMLSDLEHLAFYDNFSGTIPPELGNLTQLKSIMINENALIGTIPKELGNLSNLESLVIANCQLSGTIPKELGNLTELEEIYLSANQLSGNIPIELGNLTKLKELHLHRNKLSGQIPQSLLDRFEKWSFCPQNGTKFDNLDCSGY